MGNQYWVGAYSPDGGGTSQGIRAIEYRNGSLHDLGLAHPADSPSWITAHPGLPVIYAALEHRGEIATYRVVSSNRIESLGRPVPAGALLCHLTLDAVGGTLIGSCYGDGRVLAYPIAADGTLGSPYLAEPSEDPYARDGHAPRASRSHQSTTLRNGRIITTDLGHDCLRVWDLAAGQLVLRQRIVLNKGDGPRHLVEHPSGWIYVVTEHSVEVIALAPLPEGGYEVRSRTALGEDFVPGEHYPSEISLDSRTNRLYVGVRGAGSIAMLGIGWDGVPTPIGKDSCEGDWPRHHVQSGQALLVANQLSNTIVAFGLNAEDGRPDRRLSSLKLESPTCLAAQALP
ncbi:lactonase family protein [Paeniglutamicibacter sp. R2-26]|uniref:lactonase family protein n=1 Tax=Paeniglutamicibacter sp. R2-26 TaxID=3144417 RepID=UPI003EE6982B